MIRKDKDAHIEQAMKLRQQAEKIALEKAVIAEENPAALSSEELSRTLHDLRVHQIQLEMQNEELRQKQQEIEDLRARYFDLYDLAPVGYCTIDDNGLILEANLTASSFLGVARGELVNKPISNFILKEDQDIYYLHHQKLFNTTARQICELRMIKKDKTIFWAQLSSTATQDAEGVNVYRVVLSDNSLKVAHAQMRNLWWHKSKSREDERQRIALELHDELGQLLTAFKFDLLLLSNDYRENKELVERIEVLDHYLSTTIIKAVQELSSRLRPAVLDKLGLKAAVEWLIDELKRRNAIDIEFNFFTNLDELDIDHTSSTTIYRIIQEAFTNVVRHAQATSVKIILKRKKDILNLQIKDNGKGFESAALNNSMSLGLLGMRERAIAISGDLKIESCPGKGTSITLKLPLIKDNIK